MTVYGGDIIYASDVNDLQWKTVIAGSNLDRPSQTAFADDPVLQFTAAANTTYEVIFEIQAGGLSAAGFKTVWTVPSGAAGLRSVLGPGSSASQADADNIAIRDGVHAFATSVSYAGVRNSQVNLSRIQEQAMVVVSSTSGLIALQWAQVTSNATGSRRGAYSFLKYRKVLD